MTNSFLQTYHPKMGNRFTRWIGRSGLKLLGWKIDSPLPAHKKMVICLAPHTSNWDFFVGIFAMMAMGLKASWLGKHTIFVWPIKGILTGLGGLPVNRKLPKGVIEQVVDEFDCHESMVFAMAPEGTRKYVAEWKNGFLRIAQQARVPLCLGYFDAQKKAFGFADVIWVDDLEQDMKKVREFYKEIKGIRPDNA